MHRHAASLSVLLFTLSVWPVGAQVSVDQRKSLQADLAARQARFDQLEASKRHPDIEVCLKAVRWALRHNEFSGKGYVARTQRVLKLAEARVAAARSGDALHEYKTAAVVGYRSRVDGSVQPYSISFPGDFDPASTKSLPLHLKLHGRANAMNEVNFFHRYHGKQPPEKQHWIQLDVYGRGNNAYRWAGEVDVFEALADVKRRFRIDENRITLHGFSMGGAGAWHLGMHYPHLWSSVGPGAGFVDFYRYQKQTKQRPSHEHRTLGIYDAIDYALNAFNVPVCTYGGEKDSQLLAGQSMTEAAAALGIDVKLIVGPGMGHKFDPESLKNFTAFHIEKSVKGRPRFGERRHIRFTTKTLKYNTCDWLTIEEMQVPYEPATVDAQIDDTGNLVVQTENVSVLRLARGIAAGTEIDGVRLPFESAADGLLPDVYYERDKSGDWSVIDYDASKTFPDNSHRHKRHDLQGPIDDAFMQSFVCVRGTGAAWSEKHQHWARWTLDRFRAEWDMWLRGDLPVVSDTAVTAEQIANHNLVLFGDPGSNKLLARVLPDLPLTWDKTAITVNGRKYSTDEAGVALIFPNPLNPRRYVVINSGHTFHDRDFKASNSWLFPRLGDMAVIRFEHGPDGFRESTAAAWIFDSEWKLPEAAGQSSP